MMDMSLGFQVSYQLEVVVSLLATAISAALVAQLARAKAAVRGAPPGASSPFLIMPLYEPILWLGLAVFVVRTLLLMVPGPYPAAPTWFSGAVDLRAPVADTTGALAHEAAQRWVLDSVMYFSYWFAFELLNCGVGVFFTFPSPSSRAIGVALKWSVLIAAVLAALTTIAFNHQQLAWPPAAHEALDMAFLLAPCALHAFLVALSALPGASRLSPLPFAAFNLWWRTLSAVAISAGVYESLLGGVLKAMRAVGTPLSIYVALAGDTRHWERVLLDVMQARRLVAVYDGGEAGSGRKAGDGEGAEAAPLLSPRTASAEPTVGARAPLAGARPPLQRTASGHSLTGGRKRRRRYSLLLLTDTPPRPRSLSLAEGGGGGGGGSGGYGAVALGAPLLHESAAAEGGGAWAALEAGAGAAAEAAAPPAAAVAAPRTTSSSSGGATVILPHELKRDGGRPLDRGASSTVYAGAWRGKRVALKVLRPPALDAATLAEHHERNMLLAALAHPHIVKYHGMCVAPPELILVFALAQRGSLWRLLRSDSGGLTQRARFVMALDAARAVRHLHTRAPAAIVHRDIKSPNFLVDAAGRLLLADFGQALPLPPGEPGADGVVASIPPDRRAEVGTDGWVAPEVLAGRPYGTPADVYSLGVVLWELWADAPPFADVPAEALLYQVAVAHARPRLPPSMPRALGALLTACWAPEPGERPSASAVCASLVAIARDLGHSARAP